MNNTPKSQQEVREQLVRLTDPFVQYLAEAYQSGFQAGLVCKQDDDSPIPSSSWSDEWRTMLWNLIESAKRQAEQAAYARFRGKLLSKVSFYDFNTGEVTPLKDLGVVLNDDEEGELQPLSEVIKNSL